MRKPVVEVHIRAIAATSGGCAVFLGNEDKVFVMFVDQSVGTAITMFMQGTKKERPLTHDLLANILRALGAKIERVIVNDLKRGTYFARLVLSAENESQEKKIIEIDARPSDCIAMATAQRALSLIRSQMSRDLSQLGASAYVPEFEKCWQAHERPPTAVITINDVI